MLLVIPVSAGDVALACLNLRLAMKLDRYCPLECIVSVPNGLDSFELETLVKDWSPSSTVKFNYEDWGGDKNWPRPQNWAWQQTARFIAETNKEMPWLWWEADATPLVSGWFEALADAYEKGKKPFAGHIVEGAGNGHMNGVAIYPPDVRPYSTAAFLTRSAPFDRVLSRDISGQIYPMNDLIGHYLKPPGRATVPIRCVADAREILESSNVIYHGSSDGALARYLLDPSSLPDESPASFPASAACTPPSFTEQTPWKTGYFPFPMAANTVYFNCGACEKPDGSRWLFTRRWRYNLRGGVTDNVSDLAIWRIRENMTLDSTPIIPRLPLRNPAEQWEDPRVVIDANGTAYVSFATWVHRKPWAIRQTFTKLNRDWSKIELLWDAPFGGNTRTPTISKKHEKNWIWFLHDGAWWCQYAINPGICFRVDGRGSPAQTARAKEMALPWTSGTPIRGGTPPTRVGDEYIGFFHTSTTWQKPKRRYHMGAYAFDAAPPFTLRRITTTPLLSGSEADFRTLGGPLVIFPNGAILRDGEWLVTFGVNDEACGWIKIPHSAIEERLVSVQPKTIVSRIVEAFA